MNEPKKIKISRANEILNILDKIYPERKTLLNYNTPFELLIATMLAAQCTDERVNMVTPALFAAFPTEKEIARAPLESLEALIKSTGFYRNKAKNMKACASMLVDQYKGKIPDSLEELVRLPGVGRKTASVMVGNYFNKPAIIVDTHFKRVTARLGFTSSKNPDIVEKDLKSLIPPENQTSFSRVINYHGRYCCKARNPECKECPVKDHCHQILLTKKN